MMVKGTSGSVVLQKDKILIKHHLRDEREIPVSKISSIQFVPANKISYGHIKFVISGEEIKKGLKGLLRYLPWTDPDIVKFDVEHQKQFEELKEAIEILVPGKHVLRK